MNSVRDRVERPLREQPEELAGVADTPRIALGASCPTMSTRQREQLAADQNEVVLPSTRSAGGTGFLSGDMVRVRDRQVATEAMKPEPLRPKTPSELAADAGLADYNRRQAAKAREEQSRLDKIARRRQQEADEKAARERKARQAQIQFQENLVLREASDLDADEAQIFWDKLASMDKMLDAGVAAIVAEEIRNRRKF